ncbi:hypothetical protein WMC41_09610 [Shinella yambaruensis]|uniref:hypothetical protein n=1 Tax=Shinella yambaruensis TaxID=415996 RepID=UPI003D7979B3
MGGIAFARPKAFFGDGPVSFRRKTASLRSLSAHIPFPKTALRAFRGHAPPSCLHGGPKPTPQDPGKGEACHNGNSHSRSVLRLFRPCRTLRQKTKAPPPARIDTLRDPSGGGRRFRIARVLGVGKMPANFLGEIFAAPIIAATSNLPRCFKNQEISAYFHQDFGDDTHTVLIFSGLISFLFFGEQPTLGVVIGLVIITAGDIMLAVIKSPSSENESISPA